MCSLDELNSVTEELNCINLYYNYLFPHYLQFDPFLPPLPYCSHHSQPFLCVAPPY